MEVLSKFLLPVPETAEALGSENYFRTVCCFLSLWKCGNRKLSQYNKIWQKQYEKDKRKDKGEKNSECGERQAVEDTEWNSQKNWDIEYVVG